MVLKNTFVAWEEAKIKTIIYTHTHKYAQCEAFTG